MDSPLSDTGLWLTASLSFPGADPQPHTSNKLCSGVRCGPGMVCRVLDDGPKCVTVPSCKNYPCPKGTQGVLGSTVRFVPTRASIGIWEWSEGWGGGGPNLSHCHPVGLPVVIWDQSVGWWVGMSHFTPLPSRKDSLCDLGSEHGMVGGISHFIPLPSSWKTGCDVGSECGMVDGNVPFHPIAIKEGFPLCFGIRARDGGWDIPFHPFAIIMEDWL